MTERIYHPSDVTVVRGDNGEIIGYKVSEPAPATPLRREDLWSTCGRINGGCDHAHHEGEVWLA